jgi:hypothetical protein
VGGLRTGVLTSLLQNAKALTFTLTPEEVEELSAKSFKGKT